MTLAAAGILVVLRLFKSLKKNMLYRCQSNLGVFDVSIVLFHLFRFESVPLKKYVKVKGRDLRVNGKIF